MTQTPPKQKLLAVEPWLALVLARIGGGARVQVADRTIDLALTALPHAVMRPLLMSRIEATLNGQLAEFLASPRLIESLIGSILPDARIASLTPATRAMALEAALARSLDELEVRLGIEIVVRGVVDGADGGQAAPNAGLRLGIDGAAPILVPVHIPDAMLKKLIALQAGVDPKDPALDPEVPLAVRVGRGSSTATELASLAVNDVVVLEETLLDDNRVCLIVDDLYATTGELDSKTLRLDGALAPIEQSFLQRFSGATDRSRRGAPSNGSEPTQPVVVDLAYRMAPVSELLRIDTSDPIPLPQAVDGLVEVRSNRRRIATGRLVRVGSAVGVRILRTEANVRS